MNNSKSISAWHYTLRAYFFFLFFFPSAPVERQELRGGTVLHQADGAGSPASQGRPQDRQASGRSPQAHRHSGTDAAPRCMLGSGVRLQMCIEAWKRLKWTLFVKLVIKA